MTAGRRTHSDAVNVLLVNDDGCDDAENDGDNFLLVLISSLASKDRTQIKRQKVAMTILEAAGLSPEVLDAADSANSSVCCELASLATSRETGEYPKFFLVEEDKTYFLGGYDELVFANENGKVLEWLSMEFDIKRLLDGETSVDDGALLSSENHPQSQSTELLVSSRYIGLQIADDISGISNYDSDGAHDDSSVGSSATSSSISTWNRVGAVEVSSEPSNDIHFILTPETSSSCVVKLTNTSTSLQPVAFKVDTSNRNNYTVSPSLGTLHSGEAVCIHVDFTDKARDAMLDLFDKLGPAAEFCQKDRLLIKYCGIYKHLLTTNQDENIDIFSSFWENHESNETSYYCEMALRVRVSADRQYHSTISSSPASPSWDALSKNVKSTRLEELSSSVLEAQEIVEFHNRTMETVSTSSSASMIWND